MGHRLGDEALVETGHCGGGTRPAGGAGGCAAEGHDLRLWRHRQGVCVCERERGGVGGHARTSSTPCVSGDCALASISAICHAAPCCPALCRAAPWQWPCRIASHRCPQETCLDDLFALHLDTLTWERVPHSAPWPCARESHSMAALPAAQPGAEPSAFMVFGGNDFSAHRNDIWVFDAASRRWACAEVGVLACRWQR